MVISLHHHRLRRSAVLGAVLVWAAALAGCAGPAGGPATPAPASPAPDPACAEYARYGDLSGTTVSVLEPVADDPAPGEAGPRLSSFDRFESCTGTTVRHVDGSVGDRLAAGDPPDLAYVPDPAALRDLVRTGAVKPAPPAVSAGVQEFYPETYEAAGSVDGTLYAAPLDAGVESLVWYSPRVFAARGYAVPTTWDEMLALSARIVTDGGTPWCAGAEAGALTGWPLADFLEDAVLRDAGPGVFDRWVSHAVPADSPQVVAALDRVGAILRNPSFVNGGIGGVASIATTAVRDGGQPVRTGGCYLHRQADSYASAWPDGTTVGPDGDVFAFPLPPPGPDGERAALVRGGFVAALSDRREVQAVAAFLTTPQWADARAGDPAGGLVTANSGLDPAGLTDPVDRLSVGVLQDPRVTLRFDGTDRMPPEVGSGSLPQALVGWVNGVSSGDTLAAVESSWPR